MAQRILAVLSAILLVGAVALATIGPPDIPLAQFLYSFDQGLTQRMHRFVTGHMTEWVWSYLAVPLLARPAWLIPASIGLVCGGMAMSLSNRKPARRSHRRSQ